MTTSLTAVLVDDEPLALKGLRLRLAQFPDVEVIGEAKNGREAVKAIRTLRPDVVFLDIQMPGLSGFDVINSLAGSVASQFVFVTAYDEYALKAFEAHALDYLLKPVDIDRLASSLQQVRRRLMETAAAGKAQQLEKALQSLGKMPETASLDAQIGDQFIQRLNIKDRGRVTVVPVEDIEWIDAAGDYMCVHVGGETHVMRETMKALERQLDPSLFKRVHRSAIVNLNKVKALEPHNNGECFLMLDGGGEVKVSRSYRAVVNKFI